MSHDQCPLAGQQALITTFLSFSASGGAAPRPRLIGSENWSDNTGVERIPSAEVWVDSWMAFGNGEDLVEISNSFVIICVNLGEEWC